MTIEIHDVTIKESIDISTHDGIAFRPVTMSVGATINNIWVDNIMLPYIPITSKDEIIKEIKKALRLEEFVEEKH